MAARRRDAAESAAGLVRGADAALLSDCDVRAFDLVVNATPLGMQGEDPPIDVNRLNSRQFVVDTVYHPMETPLLAAARAPACPASTGSACSCTRPRSRSRCGPASRHPSTRCTPPPPPNRRRDRHARRRLLRRRARRGLAARPADRAGPGAGAGDRSVGRRARHFPVDRVPSGDRDRVRRAVRRARRRGSKTRGRSPRISSSPPRSSRCRSSTSSCTSSRTASSIRWRWR